MKHQLSVWTDEKGTQNIVVECVERGCSFEWDTGDPSPLVDTVYRLQMQHQKEMARIEQSERRCREYECGTRGCYAESVGMPTYCGGLR